MSCKVGDVYMDRKGLYGEVVSVGKQGVFEVKFIDNNGNKWNMFFMEE